MLNAITHAELLELLNYKSETGEFIWKSKRRYHLQFFGSVAGSPNRDGYIHIKINGRLYGAHRLAWFYVHGEWPKYHIDHINGLRADNRLCNLREVTHAENHQNRRSHKGSSSKYVGVSYYKQLRKYIAYISVSGKRHHLGYFATEEEAYATYCAAKRLLHPFSPDLSAQ